MKTPAVVIPCRPSFGIDPTNVIQLLSGWSNNFTVVVNNIRNQRLTWHKLNAKIHFEKKSTLGGIKQACLDLSYTNLGEWMALCDDDFLGLLIANSKTFQPSRIAESIYRLTDVADERGARICGFHAGVWATRNYQNGKVARYTEHLPIRGGLLFVKALDLFGDSSYDKSLDNGTDIDLCLQELSQGYPVLRDNATLALFDKGRRPGYSPVSHVGLLKKWKRWTDEGIFKLESKHMPDIDKYCLRPRETKFLLKVGRLLKFDNRKRLPRDFWRWFNKIAL